MRVMNQVESGVSVKPHRWTLPLFLYLVAIISLIVAFCDLEHNDVVPRLLRRLARLQAPWALRPQGRSGVSQLLECHG